MGVKPLLYGHKEIVRDRYVLAADLGQSTDPTAVAVIHHRIHRHMRVDGYTTTAGETFDVRYLQRLPLGLSYVEQVAEIGKLLARPPLNTPLTTFVIDYTGVGRAVGDLFDSVGLEPLKISITAGEKATSAGLDRWHVPKAVLVSTLDARLHLGELRIAKELTESGALADELKDFRRKVSAAGRYSYEARIGRHDDLVLAVAIGLWAIVGKPEPPVAQVGVYTYFGGVDAD